MNDVHLLCNSIILDVNAALFYMSVVAIHDGVTLRSHDQSEMSVLLYFDYIGLTVEYIK